MLSSLCEVSINICVVSLYEDEQVWKEITIISLFKTQYRPHWSLLIKMDDFSWWTPNFIQTSIMRKKHSGSYLPNC